MLDLGVGVEGASAEVWVLIALSEAHIDWRFAEGTLGDFWFFVASQMLNSLYRETGIAIIFLLLLIFKQIIHKTVLLQLIIDRL